MSNSRAVSGIRTVSDGGDPPVTVDDERPEGTHRLRPARSAPPQRPHARGQLVDGEGLSQVVVRAGVEPGDAIVDAVARREQKQRHVAARAPRGAAPVQPRSVRKTQVEDHQIKRLRVERGVGRANASGENDGMPEGPQSRAHGIRDARAVLDDENPHGRTIAVRRRSHASAMTLLRRKKFA